MLNSASKNIEGRTCVRPPGDEVYTPSPRRSEGQRGQLGGRCSHRAASKTSMPTLNEQRDLFIFTISDTPQAQFVQIFLSTRTKRATPVMDKRLRHGNYSKKVTLAVQAVRLVNSTRSNSTKCPKKSACATEIAVRGPVVSARTIQATRGAPQLCPCRKPAPKLAALPRWPHSPT